VRLAIEYHHCFGWSDVKTLYFDCFSGISGDMTVGALLDLGVDFGYLKTEIGKLRLLNDSGFDADVMLGSSRVVRAQISAVKFDVAGMEDSNDTHSHAHGHDHSHSHAGDYGDSDPEGHSRDHSSDGPDDHGHVHRKASQIIDIVKASGLAPNVRERAVSIFEKLAIAEGQVHDMPPEDVEFHEVGAIDSIIDVVGAAIGFDALGVNRFLCSSINIGGGFIHCQHGVYPVPAPATANLLTHAPVYSKHLDVELVTPTGAAILAATVDRYGPMDGFEIEGVGYGAGSKAFDAFPNCLRLFVGVEAPSAGRVPNEDIVAIETNIDDMSAEELAYAAERLLLMGALDVITMPVVMKKGRSGHLLQVLALPEHEELLSRTIFEETSSIGVRRRPMSRRVLDREMVTVEAAHGKVGIKVARFEGRVVNVSPEYEDCARLARKTGLPFHQIRDDAVKSYEAIPKNR
jgi:uncharacterized protein (TIGR00299 family) protein